MNPAALDAELAEIDENLIRNELTVLERAEHLARRKAIYEAKHPEARHGFGPGRGHTEKSGNDFHSFADDTAEATGVTPRTVRQEVQIAEGILPEVKDAIADTPLADRKVDLLNIARMPADEQRAVANAARENPTVDRLAPLLPTSSRQSRELMTRGDAR